MKMMHRSHADTMVLERVRPVGAVPNGRLIAFSPLHQLPEQGQAPNGKPVAFLLLHEFPEQGQARSFWS